MGISGLLPLLKSIHKHCTLKKFAGQTIGVDAYGWLHRGTVACAIELALDKPTTKYVDFAMGRVRMLLDFGVTPYLVFDGDALPSKAGTNQERRKRRDESKALGLELYKAGKLAQAHQELQKAVDVTPYMARLLIEELKKLNVQYVVAPYEADAQLAYLEQKGIINGILSEDSDLLVFGAKRLLTKLNQYGECVEIERSDFAMCKEISLTGWTDAMFRRMAILSGCDYLTNIDKMGLKTAYRYVRKYREAEKTIRMIQFEGKFIVPADYVTRFQQAELTFIHHRVFCPIQRKMVFLNDLERNTKEEEMPYLGSFVEADVAIGVACGDLNPRSKAPIPLKPQSRPSLKENRRQTIASPAQLKSKGSLDSFFKAHRQPLTELDPNSLTPSPSQQRLLERYRDASWEPRLVSSAPQLARASTSIAPTPSQSRKASTTADRNAFLARASALSSYQPPKRQRLCSDAQDPSPSKEIKQSPFFATGSVHPSPSAQKNARLRKSKRSTFDIWSDDSIDDALLSLADVQQVASPVREDPADDSVGQATNGNEVDEETVLQSSPINKKDYLPGLLTEVDDPNEEPIRDDKDLEPFEDLLESHIRIQRDSLMKSFVYQSPSRRAKALQSLSPRRFSGLERTFAAQGCDKQIAALTSLPKIDNNHLSSEDKPNDSTALDAASVEKSINLKVPPPVQTEAEKVALARMAMSNQDQGQILQPSREEEGLIANKDSISSLRKSTISNSRPSTPLYAGSEDLIVPNSEDDESGSEVEGKKPKFDLRAFAFVSA